MTTAREGAARRVVTYNIHGAVGTDHAYDPTRVVEVIQELRPDVLGLQEVRKNTGLGAEVLEEITRTHPEYHVLFLKTLVDHRGEYGNALVTRFPVRAHHDVSLDTAAEPAVRSRMVKTEARRAIFAQLDIDGRSLWAIVTHLAVEGRARKEQAGKLVDAIHRYTRLEREPAIFMGDFNEWRRLNRMQRYLDSVFSVHVARRTFPSRIPLFPLDRIWMTSHLRCHAVWAHRSSRSRVASDHLPLCLEWSWRTPSDSLRFCNTSATLR